MRFHFLVAVPLIIGCGKTVATAPSPAAVKEARNTFKTVCALCHGESGKGDGVAATNLHPKPRDYTDTTWQRRVTDAEIKRIILKGGPAVGKSVLMPAQPQLAEKPRQARSSFDPTHLGSRAASYSNTSD